MVGYAGEDAEVKEVGTDGVAGFPVGEEGVNDEDIGVDALALDIGRDGIDARKEEHGALVAHTGAEIVL